MQGDGFLIPMMGRSHLIQYNETESEAPRPTPGLINSTVSTNNASPTSTYDDNGHSSHNNGSIPWNLLLSLVYFNEYVMDI